MQCIHGHTTAVGRLPDIDQPNSSLNYKYNNNLPLSQLPYGGAGVPPALPGVSTPFASVAALFLFFFFRGTTAGFCP
jgi:hypothetical protein